MLGNGAAAMILMILLFQATTGVAPPPDAPDRFSILVDASPPCPPVHAAREDKGDIVVCARSNQQQRLPLPDERGPPDGPAPSNPYMRPDVAMNAGQNCDFGCQVGFGPPLAPIIKGAVGLAKQAFAKKPDKTGRVAIDLSEAPVSTAGRILP